MKIEDGRESENVEDRRGMGGGFGRRGGMPIGGRSIGIGTVVLVLVGLYFGVDPATVLNMTAGPATEVQSGPAPQGRTGVPPEDQMGRFVSKVLADTEDAWTALFSQAGKQYVKPTLVLYSGATRSACGVGQAQMGPFYCPEDQKVYIDLVFFQDLQTRFRAPGDFAQAYVIAHEIGHHVQNLLGISDRVQAMRQRSGEAQANQLSVRLELQADCLAGIWAHHADRTRNILETGDVEEALNAATAIGDDRLQKQTQGHAMPDSFTHGSSAQRVRWFRRGLESGQLNQCNTFEAAQL